MGAVAIDRQTEHLNRALARSHQSEHHADGGGLPRAIGSEKAEDLPALDFEAHLVYGSEIIKPLGQTTCADSRGCLMAHDDRLIQCPADETPGDGSDGDAQERQCQDMRPDDGQVGAFDQDAA